jgi:hypothetical protein
MIAPRIAVKQAVLAISDLSIVNPRGHRLLPPHMRVFLNNRPSAHTPEQKRDARSISRTKSPSSAAAAEGAPTERSGCSGAETGGVGEEARRASPHRRRRRATAEATAVEGAAGRPERSACGQCRWRESERPASGKVPVPERWRLVGTVQLMSFPVRDGGTLFPVRAWYGGSTSAMGFCGRMFPMEFLVSIVCDWV